MACYLLRGAVADGFGGQERENVRRRPPSS